MRTRIGRLVIGITEILMQFLPLYMLSLILLLMARDDDVTGNSMRMLVLLVPVTAFYVARYTRNSFTAFFFIHLLAFPAAVIYGSDVVEIAILVAVILVMVIISYRYRLKDEFVSYDRFGNAIPNPYEDQRALHGGSQNRSRPTSAPTGTTNNKQDHKSDNRRSFAQERPSVIVAVPFIIAYMFTSFLVTETISEFALTGAFVFIICYLVHSHISKIDDFLTENAGISNMPVAQIKSVNIFYMVLQLAFATIAMFAVSRLNVAWFFTILRNGIVRLLKFLIGLFNKEGAVEPLEDVPGTMIDIEEPLPQEMFTMEEPYDSKLADILNKIFFIVAYFLIGVFILGLIAFAGYGVYRLYMKFQMRRNADGDKVEYLFDLKEEIKARISSVKKRLKGIYDESNNDKIRKIYKRRVQRQAKRANSKDRKIPRYLAPVEISEHIRDEDGNTLPDKLTDYYEKARYGDGEMEDDDVAVVRKVY